MNALIAALLAGSFVFIQCYVSGTRFAYALPAYILIGIAGVLALFASRDRSRLSWVAFSSTILCFGYLLWRAWTSPVEYLARTDLYSALACLAVYVLTSTAVTSRALRGGIIAVILALVVTEALFGGYQYAGGTEWLPFHLEHRGAEFRARGTFISPNHFAGFLEAVAPFGLAFAFWGSRTTWLRWMCAVIALLAYFGVGLSGSRGAWISSAFSLIMFTALSMIATLKVQRERFPAMLYITTLALIAAPFVIYYSMQQSFGVRSRLELLEGIAEKPIETYDIRVVNWQAAIDQWHLNQVWGTGAGTHLYYGREFRRPVLQSDPVHAHSDYLEFLAEYGLIGAALMGLLLLFHFGSGFRGLFLALRHRAEDPYRSWPELAWVMGAITAGTAYLLHSAVDFNLHLPGNALWMAFVFGILANAGLPKQIALDPESVPKSAGGAATWFARLCGFSAGAALLVLTGPKLEPEYWNEKSRAALRELRFDEAIALADRTLARDKGNSAAYFQKGEAHRLKADSIILNKEAEWMAAAESYRNSLRLHERDVRTWMQLGRTLDSLFKFSEARDAYRRAIELDPNNFMTWGNYAAHLTRVGREAEAEAAVKKAQSLHYFDLKSLLEPPRVGRPK